MRTDFAWVLSGNVLYSACQWAFVVVLAKLGSAEQVGDYALAVAVAAPIVLFANFQLRGLMVSDVMKQFAFGQYLAFRYVTLFIALMAVAGTALTTQRGWSLRWILILCGAAQALELVSDLFYGFMQAHQRMDRITKSLIFKGPLSLGALWLAMYFTHSVLWAVTSLTLARLLVLITWDSRVGFGRTSPNSIRVQWAPLDMATMLRLALPLGIIQMLTSLNVNIPRYFLESHAGAAGLGIFSAIASLLAAGNLVVAAFGQSIFLPVAQACSDARHASLRRYIAMAATVGAVLGGIAILAVILFGRGLVSRVFRPEYAEHTDVLLRLMFAGSVGFIASGLGYVLTAARCLRPQIPQLLASVLASAAASAWFIPRYGIMGAADAALAYALVQLLGAAVILWNLDRQLRKRVSMANKSAAQPLQESVARA